jgi:hypothetical protein
MLGLKESSYAYSEKELLRMVLNDNNIFWNWFKTSDDNNRSRYDWVN